MQARWNNQVIAESDDTIEVEGNHYFPPEAVNRAYLKASEHTSVCPWKGTAHYHDLIVDGEVNPEAAWYYPEPRQAADKIRNYIAFWKGVEVSR